MDQPEGLPVPGISNPISSVPLWNQDSKEWLEPIFDFADQHLQDGGALIIIHPFRLSTKSNILGYCKSYGFEIRKEWWGMNRLHLTSAVHPTSTVSSKLCLVFWFGFDIKDLHTWFDYPWTLSFLSNIVVRMPDHEIWHLFGGEESFRGSQFYIFFSANSCSWPPRSRRCQRWHPHEPGHERWSAHEWQFALARPSGEVRLAHADAYRSVYLSWGSRGWLHCSHWWVFST